MDEETNIIRNAEALAKYRMARLKFIAKRMSEMVKGELIDVRSMSSKLDEYWHKAETEWEHHNKETQQ